MASSPSSLDSSLGSVSRHVFIPLQLTPESIYQSTKLPSTVTLSLALVSQFPYHCDELRLPAKHRAGSPVLAVYKRHSIPSTDMHSLHRAAATHFAQQFYQDQLHSSTLGSSMQPSHRLGHLDCQPALAGPAHYTAGISAQLCTRMHLSVCTMHLLSF